MTAVLNYEFFAETHAGRVRGNNEDAVDFDVAEKIALLADGMGGYNAGEVASAMAVSTVKADISQWLQQSGSKAKATDARRAMEYAVDHANQSILGAAEANPQYSGMGTTLVVALFQGSRLMLGHIGDSRCYRLRSGTLQQITRDHSWLQEQVDAGLITRQQAAVSGSRNLVTRALGVEELVQVEINEFEVQADDLYLLCSDGLSEMVPDSEILALLSKSATLEQQSARLIDAANANGGRDNISVVLVHTRGVARKQGLMSRLLRV